VSTEEDGVDEPVRSTQPSLIMAPPGLEADPDGEPVDAVVDNEIMSSQTRGGSPRSKAGERDRDADGPDGELPSGDAVTAAEDTPDPTLATIAPLPADTIRKAKVSAADKAVKEDTPAAPAGTAPAESAAAETAAAEMPAVKSSLKPSFTPSASEPAPAPAAPVAPPAPAATTMTAKPAGVSSPGPSTAAPAGGYSAVNGSSPGTTSAFTGAAAGLASSVASAWQRRGSSSRPDRPRGPQLRKPAKRQAMLTLARVEPWSVMKFSFVASVVAFIILFVAVAVLYMVLAALGVFDSLQHTVSSITGAQGTKGTDISHYYSASVVLGYTAMLGALNIVLITAMSTVGSVIYNLIAKTIGGIEVTLRETE
jgi:hypothetical protein